MSNLGQPSNTNDFPMSSIVPGAAWTAPGWGWYQNSQTALQAGMIYAFPIFVAVETAYDRIGVYVQAGDAGGGEADLRIYNDGGGYPSSELLSAGVVSTNAAGAQEIVIAQTLPRGYYWLCLRGNNTPTVHCPNIASMSKAPVDAFSDTNSTGSFMYQGGYVNAVYADPHPALTTRNEPAGFFVRLRKA